MDKYGNPLHLVTRQINQLFVNKEPWQVATMTATTVLAAVWLWDFVNKDESKQRDSCWKHFNITHDVVVIYFSVFRSSVARQETIISIESVHSMGST